MFRSRREWAVLPYATFYVGSLAAIPWVVLHYGWLCWHGDLRLFHARRWRPDAEESSPAVRELEKALLESRVAATRAYRLLSHVRRDLPSEMATAGAAAVLVLAEAGVYGDSEDLEALLSQPAGGS